MDHPHYVYELRRISSGSGPTRYIGVRTAKDGNPETDNYWSSSARIRKEQKEGAIFTKEILKTFSSREKAEEYEAELHWQNMVGKNPNFYNVNAQIIQDKVDQFFPRKRYRSSNGELLWFKEGCQPDGWRLDPAKWAQFLDTSITDEFRQGSPYKLTFEGLELPEWQFIKYYDDEYAFCRNSPSYGYEPYAKLDYRNSIKSSGYFLKGFQPDGWILGLFCEPNAVGKIPSEWHQFQHNLPTLSESCQYLGWHQLAFFPDGKEPLGWVKSSDHIDLTQKIGQTALSSHALTIEFDHIFTISQNIDNLHERIREMRKAFSDYILRNDWEMVLNKIEVSGEYRSIIQKVFGANNHQLMINSVFDYSDQIYYRESQIRGFIRDNWRFWEDSDLQDFAASLDMSREDMFLFLKTARREINSLRYINGEEPYVYQNFDDTVIEYPAFKHIKAMIDEAKRLHESAIHGIQINNGDIMQNLKNAKEIMRKVEILAEDIVSYMGKVDGDFTLAEIRNQIKIIDDMIFRMNSIIIPEDQVKADQDFKKFLIGSLFFTIMMVLWLIARN